MSLNSFTKKNRVNFCLYFLFIYLVFQVFIRLSLFLNTPGTISTNFFDLLKTFFVGSLFDLVVGMQTLIPLFLFLVFLPTKWFSKNITQYFLRFTVFFMFFLMFFIGVSEYLFWDEFQTKFNFIAVDYLIYTTELLGNIQQSYNLFLIIPSLLLVSLFVRIF